MYIYFIYYSCIYLSVDIKNTGEIEGKEVIQVYSKDHYASLTPDVKRLRAFKKIKLKPGETKNVKFEIQVQDLGFVNYQNKINIKMGVLVTSVNTNRPFAPK